MAESCPICGGVGLVKTENGSRPCSCQRKAGLKARLNRIGIPLAFAGATLANFAAAPNTYVALMVAERYVEEFIPGSTRKGLLFTGSVGTGKTHLAVGVTRKLVEDKGIDAIMLDTRAFLEQVRSSYEHDSQESQGQIFKQIFSKDLILIDELGSTPSSEWVRDTLEFVIGTAYNHARPLIVTTNLPNRPAGQGEKPLDRVARQETLGDRIGMRMFSRLQQMCKVVEILGPDWRQINHKP